MERRDLSPALLEVRPAVAVREGSRQSSSSRYRPVKPGLGPTGGTVTRAPVLCSRWGRPGALPGPATADLCSLPHNSNSLGSGGTPKKGGKMLSIFKILHFNKKGVGCSVSDSLDRELTAPRDLSSAKGATGSPQALCSPVLWGLSFPAKGLGCSVVVPRAGLRAE